MKKKLETILFNCQITKKNPIAPDMWAKEPTENAHLHPNHNALSYDLILRWAFFLLVWFFWARKEETQCKPYISMALWGRTEKVTVSLLSIMLLLHVGDHFLQLHHGDSEEATPRCPPTWTDASQSQDLVPPCAQGKQRTKWGVVVPPQVLSLAGEPCPAALGITIAHGKCHFPKHKPATFTTSKLNKWFPGSWSNLFVGIHISAQKLQTGQPSFILKASGIWEGEIACFFQTKF